MNWEKLAEKSSVERAVAALKNNGFDVVLAKNGNEAKQKALELLSAVPDASVMSVSSTTCDTIGLNAEINESGKFNSARKKLMALDRKTQGKQMREIGAAPDFVVGSVHAVTEEGHALIASASGSQLPAYSYGAGKVIWVVGSQKIVKNLKEAEARLYEHVVPLEDARARKAYGVGTAVNKLLVFNKESVPGRITMILVDEKLGF